MCKLYLIKCTISGFISWQVAFFTGRSKTNGINIHTIIQTTNWVLALLIMVFTYTFNYYYLKIKHSPIILQAESVNANKSLYSFKKLLFKALIVCLLACSGLILQTYFSGNTSFPFSLMYCTAPTLMNLNFARRREIVNYFWHKIHQKLAGWPEFRFRRTRKVQPHTTPEEIEMHVV